MRRARGTVVLAALLLAACSPGGADGGAADAAPDATGAATDGSVPDAAPPVDAAPPLDSGAALPDAALVTVDASDGSADVVDAADADASASLEANARADDAAEAMLLAFWNPGSGYLDATFGQTPLTGYWTFAQAWDVVLDAAQRHGGHRFAGTLATFYAAQSAAGWSSNYYDDENWMTLALIRAYDLTGDAAYLGEAKTLYADIMAAWDTTCCGAVKGGLWWDRAHTQKASAANAGAVVSGARLYERTKDASYLSFAQQVFTFWSANMVDPTTHQVIDDVATDGTKRFWKFTYNEGLMIGAAVALAHASGDASPLALGHSIAAFMLASETASSPLGAVLTDGASASCTGDCAQFKGIAARYLATLYAADTTHAEYAALLSRSADAAWTLARDPATRLFGADWSAPLVPPAVLDATSSAAMTLATVAILEGPPPADPSDVYEAEEGVLHHVGLEASHGAFGGWGYVAGWSADGQWVDFPVNVPAAGNYDLTFRYAAGAGAASRLVFVNGANAAPNQPFPATASWDAYGAVALSIALPAGASTVSLIFSSSLGSANYLNLDRLSVVRH